MRISLPDPRLDTWNPPDQVAAAGGAIWIDHVQTVCCQLLRIDATTGQVKVLPQQIDVGPIVGDDGSLWVSPECCGRSIGTISLARVDPVTGTFTVTPIPSGLRTCSSVMAVGLGSIWVSTEADTKCGTTNLLVRLDESTGREAEQWPIGLGDLQVACGFVWGTSLQADGVTRSLVRFDPLTAQLTTIGGEVPLVSTPDGCWHWTSDGFQRVAPGPSQTTPTPEKGNLQFAGTSFWDWPGRYLQRWDPLTGQDTGPKWIVPAQDLGPFAYQVGEDPSELRLLAVDGSLWMVSRNEIVRFNISAGI